MYSSAVGEDGRQTGGQGLNPLVLLLRNWLKTAYLLAKSWGGIRRTAKTRFVVDCAAIPFEHVSLKFVHLDR